MGIIDDIVNDRDGKQYEPRSSEAPPGPGGLPLDPKTGRPVITIGPKPTPVGTRMDVKDAAATGHSIIENELTKKASDKDIDYSTGAPFATRVLLQRASNPDEAKAVLSKSWGEGNYGQDYNGDWWVKHDGKRVAVLPNTITGSFENFAAGMAGSSAATGGAIAGGAVGEMVFPLGGGIPGAMVGAALGRGLDDLTKWVQGTFAQKPADVVSSLENEATLAGGFQAAGPLARSAWWNARRFISTKIADTTPESRAMSRDIAGPAFGTPQAPGQPPFNPPSQWQGARAAAPLGTPRPPPSGSLLPPGFGAAPGSAVTPRPGKGGVSPFINYRRWQRANLEPGTHAQLPLRSAAPGLTGKVYKQELRNIIRGKDPQEANRILYLKRRIMNIFRQEGMTPQELDTVIEEVQHRTYEISRKEAGELVADTAHTIDVELRKEAQAQLKQVDDAVTDANAKIMGISYMPDPLTPMQVADRIVAERIRTSKMLSKTYQTIDRLNGDKALVPTALIRQVAKSAMWKLPKSAIPPIIKEFASKKAFREITFEQAHAVRTIFRELADITDATPLGTRKGYYARMAGAIDKAMREVPPGMSKGAYSLLKQADDKYSEHIRRFESTEINQILKQLNKGYMPTAGSVAKLIMKPDKPNLAKMIFKMLDEKTQRNVILADMRNLINEASYIDNRGATKVDGKALMETMRQRRSLMNRTYPGKVLRQMREYAHFVAARDGKIDVDAFKSPEGIMAGLQKAVGAQRAAEAFAKENPLGALMSANPTQVDAALRLIINPGDEAITESSVRSLGGVDSPAWKAVRRWALMKMFSESIVETSSLATTIGGKSIEDWLAPFTERQQEFLFPHGLADDLRLLSKEAKFLFPRKADDTGMSLAAANIKTGIWLNPHAVSKYLYTSLWGYVADHPRLIRFLADEYRIDGPIYARSTMSVLGQWITDTVLESGPGQGKPHEDIDRQGHIAPMPEPISFGGPHA